MTAGHSRSDDHPERSAESDDWVEAARDVRTAYRELYSALGGNDEDSEEMTARERAEVSLLQGGERVSKGVQRSDRDE